MSTRALRVTLLVFLAIYTLPTLFFVGTTIFSEQLGFRLSSPDIFDMAYVALMMAQATVGICSIIGIIRAIKNGAAPLPNILHFPVIWCFTGGLFSQFFLLLRRPDPMRPELDLPWWTWLYTALFLLYATACAMYYARERVPADATAIRWAGSWSRLGAYLLDIALVMTIFFVNVRSLAFGRSVLDDIPFMNDSPYPMISIVLFIYYFACEAVFARTLGKAVNGTFVVYERGRVLSALVRTLSRFLPLEAFSFIGRYEGWHDQLSRTTVRKANKQEPIGRPEDEVIKFSPPDLSQENAV